MRLYPFHFNTSRHKKHWGYYFFILRNFKGSRFCHITLYSFMLSHITYYSKWLMFLRVYNMLGFGRAGGISANSVQKLVGFQFNSGICCWKRNKLMFEMFTVLNLRNKETVFLVVHIEVCFYFPLEANNHFRNNSLNSIHYRCQWIHAGDSSLTHRTVFISPTGTENKLRVYFKENSK